MIDQTNDKRRHVIEDIKAHMDLFREPRNVARLFRESAHDLIEAGVDPRTVLGAMARGWLETAQAIGVDRGEILSTVLAVADELSEPRAPTSNKVN